MINTYLDDLYFVKRNPIKPRNINRVEAITETYNITVDISINAGQSILVDISDPISVSRIYKENYSDKRLSVLAFANGHTEDLRDEVIPTVIRTDGILSLSVWNSSSRHINMNDGFIILHLILL